MSRKVVSQKFNLNSLPRLPPRRKARLAALKGGADTLIDCSDIPPVAEAFWQGAERGKFYKPVNTATTLRIDADVLAWFRLYGKGNQSPVNALLRRAMMDAIKR